MRRETLIEDDLRTAVTAVGGMCLKLPSHWYKGIPDRLVLLPGGRVHFVELKRRKGRTAALQKFYRKSLSQLGFQSHIIEGTDQLREFTRTHVESSV